MPTKPVAVMEDAGPLAGVAKSELNEVPWTWPAFQEASAAAKALTEPELVEAIREIIAGQDLTQITQRTLRERLEQNFGLQPGSLEPRRSDIRRIVTAIANGHQETSGPSEKQPLQNLEALKRPFSPCR